MFMCLFLFQVLQFSPGVSSDISWPQLTSGSVGGCAKMEPFVLLAFFPCFMVIFGEIWVFASFAGISSIFGTQIYHLSFSTNPQNGPCHTPVLNAKCPILKRKCYETQKGQMVPFSRMYSGGGRVGPKLDPFRGCHATHSMRAAWWNAISSIIAFCHFLRLLICAIWEVTMSRNTMGPRAGDEREGQGEDQRES